MSFQDDVIFAAIIRAYNLTDYNTQCSIQEQFEFQKQTILDDESLTLDEKNIYDRIVNF